MKSLFLRRLRLFAAISFSVLLILPDFSHLAFVDEVLIWKPDLPFAGFGLLFVH